MFKFRFRVSVYPGPFFMSGAVFLQDYQKKTVMRKLNTLAILFMSLFLTSCDAIGDIFGAGIYVGMFIVIFVIVLIVVVIMRIFRRR